MYVKDWLRSETYLLSIKEDIDTLEKLDKVFFLSISSTYQLICNILLTFSFIFFPENLQHMLVKQSFRIFDDYIIDYTGGKWST